MIKIAPSILSSDLTKLGEEVREVTEGGAEYIHVDVMDGLFVPNITIGIPVVECLSRNTDAFLDVHLMIDRPHRYVRDFCAAGATLVMFHIEADEPQDIFEAISIVRSQGKKVGIALKPKTPAVIALPYLKLLDMVLVMTVEPGFSGQSFMADQLPKIETMRALIDASNPGCELEVDGGVSAETAGRVKAAGADVLVAGSAVFGSPDRKKAIQALRKA